MPKILTAIPALSTEVIRDKVAAILTDEIPNQATLLADAEVNATVYKERVSPVGYDQCPCLNVMVDTIGFEGQTQLTTNATNNFFIDIITKGKNTVSKDGDFASAESALKVARVVRGILEAPVYKTLDFAPGFISHRKITKLQVSEPRDTKDSKHMIMIRMEFEVKSHDSNIPQSDHDLGLSRSQFKLDETDKGHLTETVTN